MLRVDDLEEEEDCDRGQSSQDEESQFCDQLAGKSTSHFKGINRFLMKGSKRKIKLIEYCPCSIYIRFSNKT